MSRVARRFLKSVWGEQPGTGFVFLSVKDWESGSWDDHSFNYPLDHDFRLPTTKDLYFAPNIFMDEYRRKVHARPGRWLYADLDEVDPRELDLVPTIAWETSPRRYQALWRLSHPLSPNQLATVNQLLTYHIGADKGGWSLTKVLRVPGSVSTKHEQPFRVTSLWLDGPSHEATEVYQEVRQAVDKVSPLGNEAHLSLPGAVRRPSNEKIREALPLSLRRALVRGTEQGRRSETLWKIELKLLEAGIAPEQVFALLRKSPVNKHQGREEQLWREIQKAATTVGSRGDGSDGQNGKRPGRSKPRRSVQLRASVASHTQTHSHSHTRKPKPLSYKELVDMELPRPAWSVEGIWSENAHGGLFGEPKTYKSVLATDLAVSVASGTPFLNHFPVQKTGPVLIVEEENGRALVQDRIFRIAHSRGLWYEGSTNGDQSIHFKPRALLPIHFSCREGFDLTDLEWRRWLIDWIDEIQPALLILDPIYQMTPGLDENSARDMTPVLHWLTKLKRVFGVGTMIVHHYSKPQVDSPKKGAHRIAGTGVFHRWYESALLLERPDLDEPIVKMTPNHRSHGIKGAIELEIDLGEHDNMYYSVEVSQHETKRERDKALTKLITDTIPVATVAEVLEITPSGARKRLEREGFKIVTRKTSNGRQAFVKPKQP